MLIRATDIEVSFSTHLVLRGASITVSKGECVALIGNNGSGKSTLLKVLSGALKPNHGTVERNSPAGLLEQNPTFPGETVREALDDAQAWHQELQDAYQAAKAGVALPLQAVEHMYVVTEPMPDLPDPFPVIRDLDRGIYIKGTAGALVIGGFEPDAVLDATGDM